MGFAEVKAKIPARATLVAVSKFQPAEKVQELLEKGHRVFGENRVQEAAEKFPALKEKYPDIELHFIGHLQTNKAKEAVKLFDVIESVDRPEIAEALAREMEKQGRSLPCFIQVNTGDEPQKGGVTPEELPALLGLCREKGLKVAGLMCIPPAEDVPDPHFALLHKLAGENGLEKLSMGMSADFEAALRFGATHVRIGTALFGERQAASGT